MTLEEIRRSDKAILIPADVAEVFGCHPHAIRIKARNGTLEFPYSLIGSRVKIPREGFLAWMEGRFLGGHSNDEHQQPQPPR